MIRSLSKFLQFRNLDFQLPHPGIILLALLSLLFLTSCDEDDNLHTEIPSLVLNGFHSEYPRALEVGWIQRDSLYQVDFEVGDEDFSSLLNAEGEIVGRKSEISLKDIPSGVLSSLRKNFGDSELDEPELVEIHGETFFQLEVDKVLFDKKIVLNEEGMINTNFPFWE